PGGPAGPDGFGPGPGGFGPGGPAGPDGFGPGPGGFGPGGPAGPDGFGPGPLRNVPDPDDEPGPR
ncbi:hypothetical protein, partial [Tepidibacillus decaturensis]